MFAIQRRYTLKLNGVMKWKEFVTDYLSFTKRDRIGLVVLLAVILGVFLLPSVVAKKSLHPAANDTAWVSSLKKLEIKEAENKNYARNDDENSNSYQYDRNTNNYPGKLKSELFYFDPNTLPFEGWQKLGLRDKTIHTIQNYLNKGGHFKKPEDIKKIYGLFPDEYERIAPYIRIAAEETTLNNFQQENKTVKPSLPRYTIIDINTADTSAFIALPGIGSKLSARIVNFREKLGGFYSIDQVGETYGLPDSTFQKIKPYLKMENNLIKKININTATVDELKAHPYIRWSLANVIVAYRKEHGSFASVKDLEKIMTITPDICEKLKPYLVIE